jgi:hypothetical protein
MKIFLLLAALLILCGCQSPAETSVPPSGARLSRAQALALGKQTAMEHNLHFRNYQRPDASFFPPDGKWYILWANPDKFEGFEVVIDDQTGQILSAKEVPIYRGAKGNNMASNPAPKPN